MGENLLRDRLLLGALLLGVDRLDLPDVFDQMALALDSGKPARDLLPLFGDLAGG